MFKKSSGIIDTGARKEFTELEVTQLSIQKELEIFLISLLPRLPQTFTALLSTYANAEEYFRHFSYILHLTQEGSLYYDSSTKLFHPGVDHQT